MPTPQERQRASNEQHHLRYLDGELARTERSLRFLCKDVDAPDVKAAVYRAIVALAEAQALMRPPRSGSPPPTP